MSTTLKIGYLRLLARMEKKSLITTSVFSFPYRISLGDAFSENPFFNPYSNVGEILATAAWVLDKEKPVIFDIGGHCGFIATQLAQMLKKNDPAIYSFEPVAPTFSDLFHSVNELSLQKYIQPVCVALSDQTGFVRLNYSKRNSMLAQVIPEDRNANHRVGSEVYIAPSQTFDEFCKHERYPNVVKIDVEGWEAHVFQGAKKFLSSSEHVNTGICLEWNPEALEQTGSSVSEMYQLLPDYRFFYLNDYEGQRIPELQEVNNPLELVHCCNLFAAKSSEQHIARWKNNFQQLKAQYKVHVG